MDAYEAADIADATFQGEPMPQIPLPKQAPLRLCPFKLSQPASGLLTAAGTSTPDNRTCEAGKCAWFIGISDESGRVVGGECCAKLSALSGSKTIEILAAIYNSAQVADTPEATEPQPH